MFSRGLNNSVVVQPCNHRADYIINQDFQELLNSNESMSPEEQ
jgi:hypothetical protein